MPTTNRNGEEMTREEADEKADNHPAFNRPMNLQTLADQEDWRRRAASYMRSANSWQARYENQRKKRIAAENRVGELEAEIETLNERLLQMRAELTS